MKEFVSKKLKELVERKQDTDYTLGIPEQCDKMGIPYSSFMKYYNGTYTCPAHYLVKIASYYDVSVDYLLGLSSTSSRDLGIQDIVKKTGISEENIGYLIRSKRNKLMIFDLFNDFLDIIRTDVQGDEHQSFEAYYLQLKGCSRMPKTFEALKDPNADKKSVASDHRGIVKEANKLGMYLFPRDDVLRYYANEIGVRIANGLFKQYLNNGTEMSKRKANRKEKSSLSNTKGD